jgi:hypothetical protein
MFTYMYWCSSSFVVVVVPVVIVHCALSFLVFVYNSIFVIFEEFNFLLQYKLVLETCLYTLNQILVGR